MIDLKISPEDFTSLHALCTNEIVKCVHQALEAKRAGMAGIQAQMERRMEYHVALRERLEKAANIFPFTMGVDG